MIHVQNIVKSYGPKRALDDVSFSIERGQYVALLGVNGAGKTTLTRILATLSRPSSGEVRVAGYSRKHPDKIRQSIGVMSHSSFLYDDLSAEENLYFYGRMFGVTRLKERIDELLQQVGLTICRFDRVRTFSRGMQQRLSLARAMLHHPPILLLDEPFAGLDVNAADMVKELLDELIAEDKTVLLTVHDIQYALDNAARILILKEGKLLTDSLVENLTHEQVRRALAGS
jgi:heme ABC exporter ATP-binding subunit CcmA